MGHPRHGWGREGLVRDGHETSANAVPPLIQIRWVDKEYVPDDDVPREHGKVECVVNSQVE